MTAFEPDKYLQQADSQSWRRAMTISITPLLNAYHLLSTGPEQAISETERYAHQRICESRLAHLDQAIVSAEQADNKKE